MRDELKEIAARIQELRTILDLSVEEVAQRVGCPADEYEKYETAQIDIPISALYEIASALETDFTVLLTGEAPRMSTQTITRKGEGLAVERYPGYDYSSLAFNFAGKEMEPMLVTLSPEKDPPRPVMHGGQEFNYVLKGTVCVNIGGKDYLLKEGDCVYFDPTRPHSQRAVDGEATFLTVIKE